MVSTAIEDLEYSSEDSDSEEEIDFNKSIQEESESTSLNTRRRYLEKYLEQKMIQLRDIETSKRIIGKEDEKKNEKKKIQRRVTWKDKAFIMTPMNEEELSESDLEELGEKVLTTFDKAKKKKAKEDSK